MDQYKNFIDLSRNESFCGPNPKVFELLHNNINNFSRYPVDEIKDLIRNISYKYDIYEDSVLIGNGSSGLLQSIIKSFTVPGDEIIVPYSTFSAIPGIASLYGATIIKSAFKEWGIDLEDVLIKINSKTKIIILVNPNNPTGDYIEQSKIEDFISRVPDDVIVIVDEAYIEYIANYQYINIKTRINSKNVITLRTFSKAHGLAGLRIGYLMANSHMVSRIKDFSIPYTNNSIGLKAAIISIQDNEFISQVRKENLESIRKLTKFFKDRNIEFVPSLANYILFRVGDRADQIVKDLLECKIAVSNQVVANLPGYIRVTTSGKNEIDRFIFALSELMDSYSLYNTSGESYEFG